MNDRSVFGALEDRQYVGIGEAAALLGLSRTSVQKLVDAGRLAAVKTEGGHRRILRDSLNEHLGEVARRSGLEPSSMPAPLLPASGPRRPGVSILLVDDDDVSRSFLRKVAERALPQAQIEEARDGLEAVLLLERMRPDLLVTDLRMKPFDGYRLARMVGERPEFRGVQVLAVTSANDDEIAQQGGLPPEVPVQRKPLDPAWLTGWLQGHAQARRRQP